jgi:hypothetical protein
MLEEGVNEDVIDGFLKQGEVEFENIMNSQLEEKVAGLGGALEGGLNILKGLKNIGGGVANTWREAGNGEGLIAGAKNIFNGRAYSGLGSSGARITPEPGAEEIIQKTYSGLRPNGSYVHPNGDIMHDVDWTTAHNFDMAYSKAHPGVEGAGGSNPMKGVDEIPPEPPKADPPKPEVEAKPSAAKNPAKVEADVTKPGGGENFMRGMSFRSRLPGGGLSGWAANRLGKGTSASLLGGALFGPPGAVVGAGAGLLGRGGILGLGTLGAVGTVLGANNMLGGGNSKYGLPAYKQDRIIPGISNDMLGTGAGAIGALMLSNELGLPVGSVLPLLLGGYLGHKFLPGLMGGSNPLSQYGYSRNAMPTQF